MSTVRQGWVGALTELATFRFHDAVVDFVERSAAHEITPASNPRSAGDFVKQMLPKTAARNALSLQTRKKKKKNGPIGSGTGIVWLVHSNFEQFLSTSPCMQKDTVRIIPSKRRVRWEAQRHKGLPCGLHILLPREPEAGRQPGVSLAATWGRRQHTGRISIFCLHNT